MSRQGALARTPPGEQAFPVYETQDSGSDTEQLPESIMARDSTGRTGSLDPATAESSQTIGDSSQTIKAGKALAGPFKPKRARSSRRDPEPKDEEEEEKIPETPIKKGNPGGDPGSDPDPKGGKGGKRNDNPPKGPTQIRRRITDREDSIPKLNYLLTGVDNFARWYQGLRLFLDMKDFDEYGDYSYWDIVDGKMTEWDEGAILENDSISYRKWRKANAFITVFTTLLSYCSYLELLFHPELSALYVLVRTC